jgi:hypothetical protein
MASKSLKDLTRDLPHWHDIIGILDEIGHEPARTAAIVGTSFLEHGLILLLRANFVPLKSRGAHNEDDALFGPNGPLATLSAKIKLAHAIGLLTSEMRDDLDDIREIRNAFSHTMRSVEFETPAIAAVCHRLRMPTRYLIEFELRGRSLEENPVEGKRMGGITFVDEGTEVVTSITNPTDDGPRGKFIWTMGLIWLCLIMDAQRRRVNVISGASAP